MASGVTVGTKAILHAQSGVSKSLEGGKVYWGTPAQEARETMKQMANVKRIPEIFEKLK
jgi:UDP-3-O-[3-hydroxymyristoyl] glucosamine N-acyltransferase